MGDSMDDGAWLGGAAGASPRTPGILLERKRLDDCVACGFELIGELGDVFGADFAAAAHDGCPLGDPMHDEGGIVFGAKILALLQCVNGWRVFEESLLRCA